jgi:hypothetical protein
VTGSHRIIDFLNQASAGATAEEVARLKPRHDPSPPKVPGRGAHGRVARTWQPQYRELHWHGEGARWSGRSAPRQRAVCAALVERRGQRLLVVEIEGVKHREARAALTEALRWADLSDILIVDRIPVDGRHNAKVDYPALRKMVERT